MTPTEPLRNCTEQVGPGFRDLLVQELYRAWEILETAAESGADPRPGLLAPQPLHRRHAAWAVGLGRTPPDAAGFAEIAGRWGKDLPGWRSKGRSAAPCRPCVE